MSSGQQARLRALLHAAPDGLTARQAGIALAARRGIPFTENIRRGVDMSFKRMDDVYIDRWELTEGPPAPVYMAVEVPPDCPKPENRRA